MGQITIYLEPELEQRLREAAQGEGVSVSRWVADLVRERTRNDWPSAVRELPGSWSDFPEPEALRRELEGGGADEREPL